MRFCILFYLSFLSFSAAKTLNGRILWNLYFKSAAPAQDIMAECLQSIVRGQSSYFTQTIQIRVEAESSSVRQEFFDTIHQFRSSNRYSAFELDFDDNENYEVHLRIYFTDSLNALKVLLQRQTQQGANNLTRDQFYLIVLPKKVSLQYSVLKDLFDLCFGLSIININALIEDDAETVTLYTYYPFNEKACNDTSPAVLNRFVNRKFKWEESVFPDKINNFWQCPLTVVLVDWPPTLQLHDGIVSGSDGELLNSLSVSMNFSMKHLVSSYRGGVSCNGSLTGGFKMLNDMAGDLLIGSYVCTKQRNLFFSQRPYGPLELKAHLIPRSIYDPLDVLAMPFDIYTWTILLIMLMVKWIFEHKATRLGHGIVNSKSKRLVDAAFLLSTIILRSSYEGSVFKFLHNRPIKAMPTSLDGAVHEGYKFIVPLYVFSTYNEIPQLKSNLIISKNTKEFDEFFNFTGKYGVFASDETMVFFSEGRDYYTMKKPLIKAFLCIVFPKFSFLPQKFERKIEQIIEHEIIQNQKKIFNTKKKRTVENNTSFSIQHLKGAFELFIGLNTACLIVFGGELLSEKIRILKTVLELFH